ncbi:hypothetical protein [Actinomadura sp. 9N215]|uniref:hypothetical protein n=1 Tax=Actinomadura sp. 9N215 TaxID=3375150 RepID=UPI0037A0DC07
MTSGASFPGDPVSRSLNADRAASWPDDLPESMYTTVVAVDVVGFGDPQRTNDAQRVLRAQLYHALEAAFAMTLLPWRQCYSEDRGDGVMIIGPPAIPSYLFTDPLAHHLTAVLRRCNQLAGLRTHMRLRMAVHHGLVQRDAHGVSGRALTLLYRLLEAPMFKQKLAETRADLGLIVSDQLYADVISQGGLIDTAAYQAVACILKETSAQGWVWFPPTPGPV